MLPPGLRDTIIEELRKLQEENHRFLEKGVRTRQFKEEP